MCNKRVRSNIFHAKHTFVAICPEYYIRNKCTKFTNVTERFMLCTEKMRLLRSACDSTKRTKSEIYFKTNYIESPI